MLVGDELCELTGTTVDGNTAYSTCDPDQGHVCNTLVVSSPATVDYNFAPVLGVFEGSTGARTAAACKGPCGEPPQIPVSGNKLLQLSQDAPVNGWVADYSRAPIGLCVTWSRR